MSRTNTLRMVQCALFAAITAVCAQIIIPIGLVPVSLSLLPVILCGALLSPGSSAISMTVYLLLGAVGAPVFSGLSGGVDKLLGPTGGYIVGYVPCVLIIGLLMKRLRYPSRFRIPVTAGAMALGILVCYAVGTAWFVVGTHRTLADALAVCVWPFLLFDALKIAIAVAVALRVGPEIAKLRPARGD